MSPSWKFHFAAWVIAVGALLQPALSRAAAEPGAEKSVVDFVVGNIEFILLHELAHVLINDLQIPVIGSEETAADYLAATVLLRADEFDPARAERAREFLLATANGLATAWKVDLQAGREVQYWGSHALTIQRYYNIICLLSGSNPALFAQLPARVGMPERRAARCGDEFAKAARSLQWLVATYGRKPGDGPSAAIDVAIAAPPSKVSSMVVAELQAEGVITNIAARLQQTFRLPEPIHITVRRCHAPQAEWLPARRELVLCYELIDNYYLLGTRFRLDAGRNASAEP